MLVNVSSADTSDSGRGREIPEGKNEAAKGKASFIGTSTVTFSEVFTAQAVMG